MALRFLESTVKRSVGLEAKNPHCFTSQNLDSRVHSKIVYVNRISVKDHICNIPWSMDFFDASTVR